MCGRYALALRPHEVRRHLQDSNMPSQDSAPEDDDVRHTYNFAPGNYGLVYRADVPDYGAGPAPHQAVDDGEKDMSAGKHDETKGAGEGTKSTEAAASQTQEGEPQYRLQAMKWGLVPFWTKRNPDYGSMMRTINCRDDSLAQAGGMWNSMKQKKRCIVVAQGFYEWLKKGNQKVPHYVKRKDGQLMCFAGLWDCAKFEDATDKLYTYTIITTDSNAQLSFLHDRMPVILDPGSTSLIAWLSPHQSSWSKDLQSLLKPYAGELECYPVPREVGKVGNNSPSFVVPIDSAENKQNIANFFGNQKRTAATKEAKMETKKVESDLKDHGDGAKGQQQQDNRGTTDEAKESEDIAPKPTPEPDSKSATAGTKRGRDDAIEDEDEADEEKPHKAPKMASPAKVIRSTQASRTKTSDTKKQGSSRPMRSATKNPSPTKPAKSASKAEDGSKKITNFFGT